jgi:hypothetical protein
MSNDTKERLLQVARERLKNRPGAFLQFKQTLDNSFNGVRILTLAELLLPAAVHIGVEMGSQKALDALTKHLTALVDDWAGAQPVRTAVEPLADSALPPKTENPEEVNRRRYQMCIDADLEMPDNDYATLPRGVGKLAKAEGVSTTAFSNSVKAHIRLIHPR